MSHLSCLVQEHGAAHRRSDQLERRLQAHHTLHFPGDRPSISWRAVAAGFMFTEGRQSTSSIIACTLDHPTTLEVREPYMRGICDLWTELTGCTDHEVVVSVDDAARSRKE